MKRSRLRPGQRSLERGSTFAPQGTGLKSSKRSFTPASTAQREKVRFAPCTVLGCEGTPVDPAHLTPRSFGGCNHVLCVIALCRWHHRAFDEGRLDLLPHLSGRGFRTELAHMQLHYDDPISVIVRLSGLRWIPEEGTG